MSRLFLLARSISSLYFNRRFWKLKGLIFLECPLWCPRYHVSGPLCFIFLRDWLRGKDLIFKESARAKDTRLNKILLVALNGIYRGKNLRGKGSGSV